MRRVAGLLAIVLALWPGLPADAAEPLDAGCGAAIASAEAASRLPPGLLGSIAVVESGRPGANGRAAPWPWTIDVAGAGAFFATKGEAIAAVQAAQGKGIRSIDVGCMQINLQHHPNAFASLEEAFDPQANASYAAGFLTRLFEATRSWPEAAASYHSSTPGLREDYQRRVLAGWAGSARYGAPLPVGAPLGSRLAQSSPILRAQLAERNADHARWAAMGIIPAAPRPGRGEIRFAGLVQRGRAGGVLRN